MKNVLRLTISLTVLATVPAVAAPARPAITSVSHLSVYAADMAKSDDFYVKNLGAVKRDDPENAKGVRYYFNSLQFVEVLPLPEKQADPKNRLDHMAYDTADVKALKAYLVASHVKVKDRIHKGSDGSSWFDVVDPEGNTVQFVEPPKTPQPVADNPLSDHIIHFGVIIHNEAAMDPFYRTVLGFRPYWWGGMHGNKQWISQQVPDGSDWMEYMQVSGPETKGIPADMPQATAGVLNHFALGVANMEKTVTFLTGGDRVSEKNDGPKIGADGKWQFNMYDPDGTRAEFMEFHAVTKPCCSVFTAPDPEK
jgi:catechol 2,3-dioxygenase-like lactoylglutathione lyase family enzyme